MGVNIYAFAQNTEPRLFFRNLDEGPSSEADREKLQSTSFVKTLDLVSEGPIQGFCDETGKFVTGTDILKGVYLNEIPVKNTVIDAATERGAYNFRNIHLAYKKGIEDQVGLYAREDTQYTDPTSPYYWLKDFAYSSQTISKNLNLTNQVRLDEREGTNQNKQINSQHTHSIIDQDVDWLGLTIGVQQCYQIADDGEQLSNVGVFHIWGDFTGVAHRTLPENSVVRVLDDGVNEHNIYLYISGLALSPYKEDIFVKVTDSRDIGSTRPRKVFIRNITEESYNFKSKFNASLDAVTEIVNQNLSYPSSAVVGTLVNAENFSNIPNRSFHLKLKKVQVPSNYVEKEEGPDGPTKIRSYSALGGAKGTKHTSEERHEGVWDGLFKSEPEWTDNPAWILWDLIHNDRYGIGEYIQDINVDKWEFFKLAKYCDQLVPTSLPASDENEFVQERRFSCNILINSAADAYQVINEIASVFRAIVYFDNLDIVISANDLKEPVFHFTNDTVLEGGFRYSGAAYRTRFTAVKVAYKDKDDSFLPKYEYLEDPEGILRFGLLQKDITAVGCTSRDQALRLARWILLTSNLEEENVTFQTDRKAEYMTPGQVFTVKDTLRNNNAMGGRVKHLQNNKQLTSDNFILLDQSLDLDNYKYKSISFVIPSEDGEHDSVYKTFVHRHGEDIGGADDGNRSSWNHIPLNSAQSDNPNLNNYLVNTPSGTKILTNSNEDLILLKTSDNTYTSSTALHRTLNDYFLESGVLKNLRHGADRSENKEKLREGSYYVLDVEDSVGNDVIFTKEYTLLSKKENGEGIYSIVGLEYNREKFGKTDVPSDIYDGSTFNYDNTLKRKKPGGEIILPPGDGGVDPPEVQIISYGYPKENTVDLLVDPKGFINQDGSSVSIVNYYFHDTLANGKYYTSDQSNTPRYEIRVQEIDEQYYGKLLTSTVNGKPVLRDGQYIVSGEQSCGANKVLYDNAIGEFIKYNDENGTLVYENTCFTVTGKAQYGGTDNKITVIPNYKDSKFTDILKIERPRNISELGEKGFEACQVWDEEVVDKYATDVLSGQFELPNANGFYELRWSEANNHGKTAEKVLFFRGSVDTKPPIPPESFRVTLNNVFPNLMSFKWETDLAADTDIYGYRIYTGWIGGDNPDLENTDVYEDPQDISRSIPKNSNDYFLEVAGRNTSYINYTANTSNGEIADDDGNPISIGGLGAFHIRAVDYSSNPSDSVNSNTVDLTEFGGQPGFLLSGEIREEGKGTDRHGHYPILHAFYSGAFHTFSNFAKYHIELFDETNGVGIAKNYNIFESDVRGDEENLYDIGGSGHFEIRNVLPNTTYFGRLRAYTIDHRSSDAGESRATIGKDDFAPAKLRNFRVYKQFSNFRFTWSEPLENDADRVLIYTGVGGENFDFTSAQEDSLNKITDPLPAEYVGPFASVNPDDSPAFPIDKFRHPDGTPWEKEQFPFHALVVDTSHNTGMYVDGEYVYIDLTPPTIHTSGSLGDDGKTYIHVFYSGISQNDQSFKYYHTEYQNIEELEFKSYQDRRKAYHINESDRVHEIQKIGKGSGHFSFEAAGNRFYEVTTKVVLDVLETDFGDDVPLTNSLYGKSSVYVWAPPDQFPPPPPSWISSRKNGNNIFLSWANPDVYDFNTVQLYTGYQNKTGKEDGTYLHQEGKMTSEIIALKDFHANTNKDLYFFIRAKDTSNNLSDWAIGNTSPNLNTPSGQIVSVGRTKQLDRDEIVITSGINLDERGDGAALPYIQYQILDWPVNFQHAFYHIELSRNDNYNPLVASQTAEITYGPDFSPDTNAGSGTFENLLANEKYYLRARIQEHDGKYSYYTDAYDNPILTPSDDIPPIDPVNFYITSGPKQVYLEWEWGNGISRDTAHVLIYKTGVPTGRIENTSHKTNNCWSIEHISGYFEDNPEEYTYKQPASTSYIDNDIETGIVDPIHGGKQQTVLYHYLLKTVDRSNNTGQNFVSGISNDEHSSYWVNGAKTVSSSYINDRYATTPHTMGYITGGAISAHYIHSVFAGRILTDRITAADFILSHPSGRVLSDNVYSMGSNDQTFAYSKGKGLYIDHKMFRIGDPEPGGHGLFWTGHKDNLYGDFTKPTFSKDRDGFHSMDIDPNTLEIRGNLTAGQVLIGASTNSALYIDTEGNLSIGKQSRTLSGFFRADQGVSGIMGEIPNHLSLENPEAIYVQVDISDFDAIQRSQFESLQFGGGFLETNWVRGYYQGWEIRQIEEVKVNVPDDRYDLGYATVKLGIPNAAYEGFDFSNIQGNTYELAGVVCTGSKHHNADFVPAVRDWWRIHETKFKVTKEGSLFAADARIMGTARADSLEVNKTIVLGDVTNQYTSIIQSYGYVDGDICEDGVHPSGWRIVGDGHAVFKSIDIRSGIISGSMGLSIGKTCGTDNNYFRVNQKGEMSVGDSLVLKHNKFYVSRNGDMRARNAVISGDLEVTGIIDVGGGIRLCSEVYRGPDGNFVEVNNDKRGIYITKHDIRSSNFSDSWDNGPGFKITNKGRAVFHDVTVTGGFISGVSIIAGQGNAENPYFKVFNNGEMSIGSYDSPSSAPKNTHPFYVSKKGELYAEEANIRGTITGRDGLIGSLYIGEDFVSTYSWNVGNLGPFDPDGSASQLMRVRTENDLETELGGAVSQLNPYKRGLYTDINGNFSIVNHGGRLIGYDYPNDYLTITGLASSNTDSPIFYRTLDQFGKGNGFFLSADGDTTSWLANFRTDPSSATGVANLVETQINGDIQYPTEGNFYYIMNDSPINYEVLRIYAETNDGTCSLSFFKNKDHATILAQDMNSIDDAGTTQFCQGLDFNYVSQSHSYIIIKVKSVAAACTSIRFRFDLQRSGGGRYTSST